MRPSVVLPAPFGPSRPNTIPAGTSSLAPSSATVSPKRLTTPSTPTAGTEEPRPFTPVAGPVPGSTRPSLSAVMSISSTGRCGPSRQTQVCRQAGEWSSPDRGDSPERATGDGRFALLTARTVAWDREGGCRDCVADAVAPGLDSSEPLKVPQASPWVIGG